jgi:hypothetical protein
VMTTKTMRASYLRQEKKFRRNVLGNVANDV